MAIQNTSSSVGRPAWWNWGQLCDNQANIAELYQKLKAKEKEIADTRILQDDAYKEAEKSPQQVWPAHWRTYGLIILK